ncbi:MAG: DUF2752 domain-containing protein [Myxococcota bacterium]
MMDQLTAWIDRFTAWVNSLPERPTNRAVGLLIGLPTWMVLGIAAWLTPAAQGYGTHMQLGLGGCTMLVLTGWPCPMCGMTTTFTLLAHFRFLEALVNQPFGVVLFACTVIGAVVGLVDLLTARGLYKGVLRWIGRREQLLAIGLLVGMVLGWVYKSVRMHPEVFGLS